VTCISATDIDDGNNSIVIYKLEPKKEVDRGYLRIDANTAVIFLDQTISVSYKTVENQIIVCLVYFVLAELYQFKTN